jgi:hypothetical protein
MADTKISGLPASTTPLDGTEVLPIVQGATTKQVSVTNLTTGRAVPGLNFAPSGSTIPTNGLFLPAANSLGLATNGINRFYLDANGFIANNVGGGAPSPWSTNTKAVYQFGDNGSGSVSYDNSGALSVHLVGNMFQSASGVWTSTNTVATTRYTMSNGGHFWNTGTSSGAGTTVTQTQTMGLSSTGVLTVGSGASSGLVLNTPQASGGSAGITFSLAGNTASIIALREGGSFATSLIFNTAVSGGTITEAFRINSSQNFIGKATINTAGYTVATLPAGTVGMRAYVTDALAPTYLGVLTGGGAVKCPVFYNGTAWVSA